MYKIDSSVDKPNTKYLFDEVKRMMQRGIKVGNLHKLYDLCVADQERYLKDIQTNYGIINPNSPTQVVAYLQSLNDPEVVLACAPQGKWSSNKSALLTIDTLGYTAGRDIVNFRTAKKFGDSVLSMIKTMDTSQKIHPEVGLTKTNRISYKNPAIMNIPKELLWDAVVPSKPGNILISADIKNQEPNILINMNNIKSLKPALVGENGLYEEIYSRIPVYGRMNLIFDNQNKPGIMDNYWLKENGVESIFYTPKVMPFPGATVDGSNNDSEIHLINVINFVVPIGQDPVFPDKIMVATKDGNSYEVPITFSVDFSKPSLKKKKTQGGIIEVNGVISGITLKCSSEIRKEFKRAWNAMTYGASRPGVKDMCKLINGEALYDFFSMIPELHEYRTKCQRLASQGCQEIETFFGTKLYADEPNQKALKRVLLDLPIQGTAADILSLLVKHFNEEVIKRGYSGLLSIYYTRHDELIIEAEKELIDSKGIDFIKSEISDIVEHQVDDWIPFKVEVKEVERNSKITDILEAALEEVE